MDHSLNFSAVRFSGPTRTVEPEDISIEDWSGRDYFDGPGPSRTGKVWFLTDDITDFPVIEYTLNIPR